MLDGRIKTQINERREDAARRAHAEREAAQRREQEQKIREEEEKRRREFDSRWARGEVSVPYFVEKGSWCAANESEVQRYSQTVADAGKVASDLVDRVSRGLKISNDAGFAEKMRSIFRAAGGNKAFHSSSMRSSQPRDNKEYNFHGLSLRHKAVLNSLDKTCVGHSMMQALTGQVYSGAAISVLTAQLWLETTREAKKLVNTASGFEAVAFHKTAQALADLSGRPVFLWHWSMNPVASGDTNDSINPYGERRTESVASGGIDLGKGYNKGRNVYLPQGLMRHSLDDGIDLFLVKWKIGGAHCELLIRCGSDETAHWNRVAEINKRNVDTFWGQLKVLFDRYREDSKKIHSVSVLARTYLDLYLQSVAHAKHISGENTFERMRALEASFPDIADDIKGKAAAFCAEAYSCLQGKDKTSLIEAAHAAFMWDGDHYKWFTFFDEDRRRQEGLKFFNQYQESQRRDKVEVSAASLRYEICYTGRGEPLFGSYICKAKGVAEIIACVGSIVAASCVGVVPVLEQEFASDLNISDDGGVYRSFNPAGYVDFADVRESLPAVNDVKRKLTTVPAFFKDKGYKFSGNTVVKYFDPDEQAAILVCPEANGNYSLFKIGRRREAHAGAVDPSFSADFESLYETLPALDKGYFFMDGGIFRKAIVLAEGKINFSRVYGSPFSAGNMWKFQLSYSDHKKYCARPYECSGEEYFIHSGVNNSRERDLQSCKRSALLAVQKGSGVILVWVTDQAFKKRRGGLSFNGVKLAEDCSDLSYTKNDSGERVFVNARDVFFTPREIYDVRSSKGGVIILNNRIIDEIMPCIRQADLRAFANKCFGRDSAGNDSGSGGASASAGARAGAGGGVDPV